MYLNLLVSKVIVLFDEDMRKQLKRKKHLEEILNQLNHKKLNLIKKINLNETVNLQKELSMIDRFIRKVKNKLETEFDN